MMETYTNAEVWYESEINEGRISMDAHANDATAYIKIPERTPLSGSEPCLRISVSADDAQTDIELNARGVDALQTALDKLREGDDD
jgi:hypothetical protein